MNGRVFRATVTAQARYLAPVLALTVVIAALLPLLTVQGFTGQWPWWGGRAEMLLQQSRTMSPFYPAVALCLGIFFSMANWLPDVTTRWVYVFTLPISRARITLIRLLSGATLLLPAVLVLWLAGLVGSVSADLPDIIESHAGALALRFGAATLVTYAAASLLILFGRRMWYLGVVLILLVILEGFGVHLFSSGLDLLFLHPMSPFHALAGDWLYLDV